MRLVLIGLATALIAAHPLAQAPNVPTATKGQPKFEVASIKRHVDGSGFLAGGFCLGGDSSVKPTTAVPIVGNDVAHPSAISPGTCRFGKTTLREIIAAAYGVPRGEFQRVILGGPDWLDRDLFDIEARAGGTRSQGELERMLQALLEDRFSLRLRRDKRDLNGYVLSATTDRYSNLKAANSGAPGSFRTKSIGGSITIDAVATPMSKLTAFFANLFGQPVTDKTGLDGAYDFTLSWTMGLGERTFNLPGTQPQQPGDARPGPSLFTAVRELGLRLEATKIATDVWVVDQATAPTAN